MHATIKFEGLVEKILEEAVKEGLAKTKSEALRLGVIELNNRYHLLESLQERIEEEEDIDYIRSERKKLKSGKIKLHSEKELEEALKE